MKNLLASAAVLALLASPVFAADAVKADAKATSTWELQDGTKVWVDGDNVFVVATDGTKTAAPDGTHTLKDGTTLTTKGGKKVAK